MIPTDHLHPNQLAPMATTEALPHDAHADDHHGDHPAFLAHHFDTPEQQFDSGKLGMWLFLVTEVLFFSGLFVAYTIYRFMRPEVFTGSSEFLNTQLGAINTGVLLFSSLTMAWAVRCAQLEQHRLMTGMLGATLGCAAIFLGVKAVEYSHKFELGLLPPAWYSYDPAAPHHPEGVSSYLVWMSVPFALLLVGLLIWYAVAWFKKNDFQIRVAGPFLVAAICYFVGVGLGTVLESGESATHASEAGEHGNHSEAEATEAMVGLVGSATPEASAAGEDVGTAVPGESPVGLVDRLAQDETNTGMRQAQSALERQSALASGQIAQSADEVVEPVSELALAINTPYLAGVFFGIYYCMTGIHAIHILAGMGVIAWLIVRSVRQDFNRHYFGPVDYVGLYWHIVDLIWIYLFPLLYLIR